MANTVKFLTKNGLKTQNIDFTSPSQAKVITVTMLDGGILSFSGSVGQLMSLSDSMTGTIYGVYDISGIPSIEVDDTGVIRLAQFSGNVLFGTATDNSVDKVQVNGSVSAVTYKSTVATGTAPFTVASTTRVANLNAATAGNADTVTNGLYTTSNLQVNASNTSNNADVLDKTGIYYGTTTPNPYGQSDGAFYANTYSSSWQHQIYGDYRSGGIAVRGKNNGVLGAWRIVLDSVNYNTYAPTKTGTGASGTWGISITGNAATVTTNANLTGDVTSVGNATTLQNAPVIAKVLTGYVSGAGTVAATDSILSAIQKLNGNDSLKAPLAGPTFTGVPAAPTAAVGTNTTQIATTAFVNAEIANDAAPIAHVGAGGGAHADAVLGGASGFMTGAEKSKLAGIAAGANTGTVTSVGGTGTVSGLTLSGTVTTSGNLTLGGTLSVLPTNFASQTASTALIAPSAANGVPTFRYIELADIVDAWTLESCRVATTANITLSGTQTIDGVAVVAGDRVLVKNQSSAGTNGVYIVAAGAWARSADASTSARIAGGTVNVDAGTQGGQLWSTGFKSTDTLGTTAMVWSRVVDLSMTLPVANGGTGVTTSTGTGSVVLSASPTFTGTVSGITKAMVGLANVDNTADSAKPVSTAQQTALNLKANLASPAFTGSVTLSSTTTPIILNASAGTTGQVLTSAGTGATPTWTTLTIPAGTVTSINASGGTTGLTFSGGPVTTSGTLTMAGTLAVANGGTGVTTSTGTGSVVLSAGPTFTGVPTAPTAAANTNTTQLATTAFVNAEIANDAAPISHVGSGAAAHAAATTSVAGFMSAADKQKLDDIAAGATANTGTVTSVGGTGTVNGLTLSGSVTTSGNLTLGGTLSNISNSSLTNSSLSVGSTSISLGDTATTLAGLTSVTSTTFVGSLSGNSSTSTKLATARAINGVNFDGTAAITIYDSTKVPLDGTGATGTWGISISGNAATATNVAYSGLTGTAPTWNQNTTGNAATATKLATARTINGVNFDGTANITVADATKAPLTGAGTSGTWPISVTGNAATATKLATARTINGVNFDGTANITVADSTKVPLNGTGATGTWGISISGNAATATNVAYSGLTGAVPTWNQSTTGNAATATKLQTARTINGIPFDGSANITISASGSPILDTSVISTNTTAVVYKSYVITASLTLTLPTSPAAGNWIDIQNSSGTITTTIARNGQKIMSLAEDMTMDIENAGFRLMFADATRGWVII